MARRAPTRCTQCPKLATNHGRCDNHQRKPWANPSANTRTLTRQQRDHFRTAVLNDWNHTCGQCGQPASEADHITPIGLGGNPHDWEHNGMALCPTCHTIKTAEDNKKIRAHQTNKTW